MVICTSGQVLYPLNQRYPIALSPLRWLNDESLIWKAFHVGFQVGQLVREEEGDRVIVKEVREEALNSRHNY